MTYGVGRISDALNDGEQAADRVLASYPDNARAHYVKGMVAAARGAMRHDTQFEGALTQLKAAIAGDRNYAGAYAEMGNILTWSGRAREALEPIEKSIRLDPHSGGRNMQEYYMCDAYAHLGEWEQAAEWCEKSVASNPEFLRPYFDLAAAYGWLGRSAEANAAVAKIQKLSPGFSISQYQYSSFRPMPGNEIWKTEDHRIMEGLRRAGLP
jgi:tetratricopeptide (TPR) repeat protein